MKGESRNKPKVSERLILVPCASVLYILISFFIYRNDYDPSERFFNWEFLIEIGISLLVCLILTEFTLLLCKFTYSRLFTEKYNPRKLLLYAPLQFLVNICIAFILTWLLQKLGSLFYNPTAEELWKDIFLNTLIAFFIASVYSTYWYVAHWNEVQKEKIELQMRVLHEKEVLNEAKLVSLKLQIDPHFLFNNFSILSELIVQDAKQAGKFLDNLSRVYRYIISNLDCNIITVREELRFLDSYIYLIKIRHGDNICVDIRIDRQCLDKYLPPAVLQILVENAIKHNKATKGKPLQIFIYNDTESLIVENAVNVLKNRSTGTHIGQNNIRERYRLLCDTDISIHNDGQVYKVILPLLDSKIKA